ncbi:lipocalin-like domain-containing protein [Prosthecobacter fusiformis]|nr:lipocalin-like domain-containing protein [Prosthecobacter fusiformis]
MRKEPARTALTALGVMLGVAVMLAIQLANSGSLRGFSAALDAVSGKAALEITAPPLGVDETLLPGMSWLREYGIATPVIESDVMAVVGEGREMLRIIGVDAMRDPALRDYAVAEGNSSGSSSATGMELMALLGKPDSLLITSTFAERHELQAGDKIKLQIGDRERLCSITAILGKSGQKGKGGTQSALAAQSLAIMDIANAQVILGKAGRVDRVELRLHEGIPVENAEQEVKQRMSKGLSVQRPQRRSAAVEKMLAAFHFNLTMLSGIALVVGVFLIYNTVSVAVMTRRREIGMLRTLGVTRGQVLRLFLGEAALLGLIGAVLGVPLAKVLAEAAIALTSTTVDTLYVATAAQVPELAWQHWVMALGIALPLSLLAAALPAREASRVTPVEAMRSDAGMLSDAHRSSLWKAAVPAVLCLIAGYVAAGQPAVSGLPLWGYFACLCAIAGMSLLVPFVLRGTAEILRGFLGRCFGIEGRLAASQIRASTHRLSVSVAALAVSLALTVAIAVMVGSFRQTVLYWVDQTLGADLYIRPGTPPRSQSPPTFSEPTLKILREHPAVLAFDGHRSMDIPYQDRIIKLGAGDFDVQMQHGRIALKTRGNAKAILEQAKAKGEVFISESFALRFKVREGDAVTLSTPKGEHAFRVAAQFYDYSNDSGTLTMDKTLFNSWFGESQPTHVAIYLKPGFDAEAVKTELVQQLDGRGFVAIFTNAGLRQEVLRIFDSTFAITWALEIIAILVAMAGVAATMMTLVLERKDEIRLLRIAGAEASQVRRTIVIESGLLGAVSQGLGLVVGMLLSLVLIHVINPQSFGWSIQFYTPWLFLLGSTLLTVIGTMIAGLWPARRSVSRTFIACAVLVLLCPAAASAQEWKPSRPGYEYVFPRDHGQHPEHKIEWWYFTGNLNSKEGRRFGYQLTFFRIGAVAKPEVDSSWALRDVWMAHLAVTDAAGKEYHHADRLNRAGPGLAGATEQRVWNEDWECLTKPEGKFTLSAGDHDFSIELELYSGKPAVIHGEAGISQKGATPGNASHYYSLTRMPTSGSIRLGAETFEVTGESWMDHEFGTSFLEKGTRGWDWFSAQLSDGSELMLFQLRGDASVDSSAGTWIGPDGQVVALTAKDFKLTPGKIWKSPGGAAYPIEWRIEVPSQGLSLTSTAVLPNQEFRADTTPGLGYWEGAVDYSGKAGEKTVSGQGYLEMTGYSGRAMSLWFGQEE